VQFTPPGSGCSIQFGTKVTSVAPGSAQSLYLVVSDIPAARDRFVARGARVSEVFHPGAPGAHFQPEGSSHRLSGPVEPARLRQLRGHQQSRKRPAISLLELNPASALNGKDLQCQVPKPTTGV